MFQNASQIAQHFVVGNADDPKSLTRKPAISRDVAALPCPVKMLSSVDFNDQPALITDKVENIAAHRNLSPKAQTIEPVSTQRIPKFAFGLCHLTSKRFRPSPLDC
jgi:hypothetical protein